MLPAQRDRTVSVYWRVFSVFEVFRFQLRRRSNLLLQQSHSRWASHCCISDLIAGMWSAEIEPHSLEQTQLNSAPAEAAIWNFKSVIKISPLRKYWLFYLLDTSFTRLYTWYNYLACNCKHTDKFPILDFILFQAFWKKICTPTVSDSDVSYSLCQHMERPIFMSMLDIKIIAVFLLF